MTKELLVSSSPHETKVAVLEDDQLVEVYFQRDLESGLVGGIYKGRVNRVLPGMQSAFVDIGLERDAFLYVSDFFEESEEYDRVFTEAENRVDKASGEPAVEPPRVEEGANAAETVAQAPSEAGSDLNPSEAVASAPATDSDAQAEPANAMPEAPPAAKAGEPDSEQQEARAHEFSRRDGPGRRHRRRGRGFRENRFGFRRESEKPQNAPEQGGERHLEPLPGESLAQYSQPASESRSEEQEEESSSNAQGAIELSGETERPDALTGVTPTDEAVVSSSDGDSSLPDIQEETATGESEEEVAAPFASASEGSSIQRNESLHSDVPFEEARSALTPTDTAESQSSDEAGETRAILSGLPEEFEAVDSEEQGEPDEASGEDSSESLLGSAEDIADAQFQGSEEPATVATQETAQEVGAAPAQSYTVRDSRRPARVSPRRGRKGGRGRFRGHFGRKSEAGGGERPRSGNHQPTPINELLKEGQEILVQIAKEPLGTKGARITSHIALPGRYLVYMPTITHIGVSRKIGSDEERLRLRNIILENRGSLTGGFIVRTAGAGQSEEDLKADLAFLTNLWNEIRARADRSKAPALIHRDLTLVERILRDLLSPDFKCVRVDNEIEYEHVLEFVNRFQPALIGHVKLYTRDEPLFEEFGVQAEIDKALKPKVWLKSGGYIVINQTEALVAIDVNTGKFVGKTNRLEDTIVKTNIDAVMEIVRQIRLRDLGGIIVIDFIDMDERRNRMKVVQALEDALRRDRAPTKILSFNEFGLVALTRKRAKQSLERTLCEPCSQCTGAGWVKSVATVSHEIVAEARKMASQIDGKTMTLRVHPLVAANLKSKEGVLISEIEAASRKEVVIKSDPAVSQERFEIF